MTVRERVFASRLIERIENNDIYTDQIGLSGSLVNHKNSKKPLAEYKRKNYTVTKEN